ncbi:protein outspread isoform X1 [Alosa sapidissima]|uniref:protein outspread isoform X1 n=1 Tax=Alosa sapidissima TaxID=34773 RepID=UPI001C094D59|nr:protein outspread isoform X1 [Alosa sapidissima]
MSTAKENPCRKFQANIFNKSKCQNCFKPRELHLLTDQDLNQAKPIYGGWLCLAPEGTDFDNPMQRSRKWQRRFFVLYEHGCLRFALDESPSTLPQGTVNMNLCTDVIDAEPKTGQKNALCIITPEQEYFIRGDNKEIINGWSEQLVVYPRTNKQNQKKKRKVEPATSQEPGPAKVAVTGSGIPEAEKVPDSSSIIWQEELQSREADVGQVWSSPDMAPLGSPSAGEGSSVSRSSDQGSVNGDEMDRSPFPPAAVPSHELLSPTGSSSSRHSFGSVGGGIPRCLSPAPSDPFPSGSSLLSNGSHISGSMSSLDSDASGSTVASSDSHPAAGEPGAGRGLHHHHHHRGLHDTPRSRRLEAEARKAEKRSRAHSPEGQETPLSPERSGRSNVIEKLEALELENTERMEVDESDRSAAREGRSEIRRFHREEQKNYQHTALPPLRRAKSLDRRTTESVMTPDLLNFKKGWMVKLDEQGQWKKYWFVLTDHSLRYYKDSIAEEASDLDGEIDLSTCYNVTEHQAQRNYGFQIHTQEGVHTLSAMTAGIRRNWIQAVMRNVRPSTAPDVASLSDDHNSCTPLESLSRPDVTQDSASEASSVEREPGPKKSRARERRREGRSKTFDWAEFRPTAQALAQQRASEAEALQAELSDSERSRRREERRRRYGSVAGSSPTDSLGGMDFESAGGGGGGGGGRLSEGGSTPPHQPQPVSLERQRKVEDEIEQHWQQVEKTPIREERRVPLASALQTRETAELEKLLESYKKGVEDLKHQLETCHEQLAESNLNKYELEEQLRTALEREQHIRIGYISPLDSPLGLEGDLDPQMKRPELVSSQAQTLTRKYQETKELLQLQELKKRNMQAQLGLSLSHLSIQEPCTPEHQKPATLKSPPTDPILKTVTFMVEDSEAKIEELEKCISGMPITLKELLVLLHSHSEFTNKSVLSSQERNELSSSGDITSCHKLLENLKYQQEVENETMRRSLAEAGDSIRNYEARLITMEDILGRVQQQKLESLKSPYGPACQIEDLAESTNRGLSQRVELLTTENEALNQRYQEIVNQLREADREIERLKTELRVQGRQEQLGTLNQTKVKQVIDSSVDRDFYERELNAKSRKLQEALVKLEELGNNLKDTEKRLQLKEATLRGLGFQMGDQESHSSEVQLEKEELKLQLAVAQTRLSEREQRLFAAEQSWQELQAQNLELQQKNQEIERLLSKQKVADTIAETNVVMTGAEMASDWIEKKLDLCQRMEQASEELTTEKIGAEKVIEEFKMRSQAISVLVEMLGEADAEKMEGDLRSTLKVMCGLCPLDEHVEVSQTGKLLLQEGEFCSKLLSGMMVSQVNQDGEDACRTVRTVSEQMLLEKMLLLVMNQLNTKPNVNMEIQTQSVDADIGDTRQIIKDFTGRKSCTSIINDLIYTLQEKLLCMNQIVSTLKTSPNEQLQTLFALLSKYTGPKRQWSQYVQEAVLEAHCSYLECKQKCYQDMVLQELQSDITRDGCANCVKLRGQNKDLSSKLEYLQRQLSVPSTEDMSPVTHIQIEGEPIDSLDKAIQLQDMVAKHRKELRELKESYEQEMCKLRQDVAKMGETLQLRSEENVKEIDSLTICMENLKRKHEEERSSLVEQFNQEMEDLKSAVPPQGFKKGQGPPGSLKERIQELVAQVATMTEEMKARDRDGESASLRLKFERDLENLKATCERGFAAMEESHQKVIDELQKKHQRELEKLQDEKERLLEEETAATISAIEAMKNAHRSELERELDKARKANSNTENADIEEIRRQHEEELLSFQREIEVLSEQYSQKCLENAHLAQALEAERQALRQCQRENQELNAHNQELNNRLAAEITKMRSMTSDEGGETCTVIQGKELYELEVMLRVKESEVQYLKQEINSLKDELQAAQRDKKYATDKYKDIYTELSIVRAKAERDLGRLREQLQLAHEALGEPTLEDVERSGYDIMKSKSNPDILKMAAAAAKRSERTMRSKSLKEGLTAEQRLHLFDNKDTKEF